MSFIIRGFIAFLCALVMACIVDLRLGKSLNFLLPVGALPAALSAPTVILPFVYYPETFRVKPFRDSGLLGRNDIKEDDSPEGYLWALAVVLSFYLPLNLLPKKRKNLPNSGDS